MIITNKRPSAVEKRCAITTGRGAQEGIFAERTDPDGLCSDLKTSGESGFVLAAMLVHNLNREMQMLTNEQQCTTTERRTAVALYTASAPAASTDSASRTADQAPNGPLTLTMSVNPAVKPSCCIIWMCSNK